MFNLPVLESSKCYWMNWIRDNMEKLDYFNDHLTFKLDNAVVFSVVCKNDESAPDVVLQKIKLL
jgi:hypothetical protein